MSGITRRQLLQQGSLALAALSAFPKRAAAQQAQARPKKLVLVFAKGGWDVTYSLDPKPGLATIDAPEGRDETLGGVHIWGDASRPNVSEFFRRHGGVCAVVNGVQMMSFVHPDCWKRALTGTASDSNPDLGAIVAYENGLALPVPYLVLGQTAYTGNLASISARAGSTKQIIGLLDPAYAVVSDAEREGISRPTFSPPIEERIRKLLLARAERDRAVRGQTEYNRRRFEDFFSSIDRAKTLRGYAGDFGGRSPLFDLPTQIDLAVKALATGLSHSVHVEYGPFDTHATNAQQSGYQETLFSGLLRLFDQLAEREGSTPGSKLLDETVVAVLSEMGRTPKLNAELGKDHWPVTSALIGGGGVRGGRTFGASDDALQALNVDFASGAVDRSGLQLLFGNLAAGILSLTGVDPAKYLPGSEAFHAIAA